MPEKKDPILISFIFSFYMLENKGRSFQILLWVLPAESFRPLLNYDYSGVWRSEEIPALIIADGVV